MFLRWVLKCSCTWCLQKSKFWWKQGKTGEKSQNRAIRTIGNCWEHFDHFPKFISCVLYLVSNLGKLWVHSFKQYTIWSWNKEVMAVWRRLCKAKRKCCSRTPFCYCWSTFWSSNYAYHISFWSLGSQESSDSNGVQFGFETKKLCSFERI